MRLIGVVLVAAASVLLTSSNAATDSKQVEVSKLTSADAAPWSESITINRRGGTGKRVLRIAGDPNQGDSSSGSSNDTLASSSDASASSTSRSDGEERGITLPSPIIKYLKKKKVPSSVVDLLNGNKNKKTLAKLRVKLLESLPPEQAANLIFLKMPKKAPQTLPLKLPKGVKGYQFKVPGVSDAVIRLKMEIWFYYRYPPTYAFKKLGLVGKDSGDVLHKQPNYKYFKSYFDAWYADQKHLIF